MNDFRFELKRKVFHMSGIIFPTFFIFTSSAFAVFLTTIICIITVGLDILRHRNKKIQYYVNFIIKPVMRESELVCKKLSSSSWMAIGLCFSTIIFDKNIAIVSMYVLFICDALAAVIGKKYGKTEIINGKTIVGSVTFFISSFWLIMILSTFIPLNISFKGILIASLLTTLVELLGPIINLNDNLSIPIIYGLALTLYSF